MSMTRQNRIVSLNNKWFGRYELFLFIIISFAGVISSVLTYSLLDDYPYNSGKNLVGVFVPPILTVFYLTISGFIYKFDKILLKKAVVLYLIQIIPFFPLFFQTFRPTTADDFSRYYLYAKNMIEHKTFWGGDRLFFKDEGNYFVTQPGYRYFVAGQLLLFRDLYRFVSFINVGLLICAIYYFQKLIVETIADSRLRTGILILNVLFVPYAIKNLLMGLPEWFTVLLLMAGSYLYIIKKKELLAMFILGMVPFFRQNLLITVVLLALWILLSSRKPVKAFIFFLVPLLLPLYHNLYFSGEWRFFVRIFNMPFLNQSMDNNTSSVIDYALIVQNILHYTGIDMKNGRLDIHLEAVIFLPFFLILYFIMLKTITPFRLKLVFITISLSAIVPAILFGTAYYPRFEFVNVIITLVTYLLLQSCTKTSIGEPSRYFSNKIVPE